MEGNSIYDSSVQRMVESLCRILFLGYCVPFKFNDMIPVHGTINNLNISGRFVKMLHKEENI